MARYEPGEKKMLKFVVMDDGWMDFCNGYTCHLEGAVRSGCKISLVGAGMCMSTGDVIVWSLDVGYSFGDSVPGKRFDCEIPTKVFTTPDKWRGLISEFLAKQASRGRFSSGYIPAIKDAIDEIKRKEEAKRRAQQIPFREGLGDEDKMAA